MRVLENLRLRRKQMILREKLTGSITNSCVKWHAEDSNIEQSIGFGQTLDMVQVGKG
jgi:hypothetical protein